MKKIIIIIAFLFIIPKCAFSEEFYGNPSVSGDATIKLDFKIVSDYLKSDDLKKAIEYYIKVSQIKNEENEKLINELSYSILSKILKDQDQHRDLRVEAAVLLAKYYKERSLEVFSDIMTDKNYVVKMGVIRALGNIRNDKAFKLIAPNINDDADNIKIAAIDALGEIGGANSSKILKKMLESKDYFTRLNAALSLFNMGNKSGMEIIKKNGITEPIDRLRLKVVQALSLKNDSSVIPLLKEALNDKNKTIRNIAMEGLINNDSKTIDYIFKDLLKMKEKYVQVKSAEYLLKKGNTDVIQVLLTFLGDKNEYIRVMAASSLIGIDDKKASDIFKNVLISKDENVRHLAADLLFQIPPSSQVTKIILSAYTNEDYYVRAKAIEALGKINTRMYDYEIKKSMYDSHSLVRMTASSIMALKGDEDAIKSIIDFLNWGNDDLRMFSIEVLSKIDSRKYLPLIRKIAFTDKSWSVGMKALEILVEIVNKQ